MIEDLIKGINEFYEIKNQDQPIWSKPCKILKILKYRHCFKIRLLELKTNKRIIEYLPHSSFSWGERLYENELINFNYDGKFQDFYDDTVYMYSLNNDNKNFNTYHNGDDKTII